MKARAPGTEIRLGAVSTRLPSFAAYSSVHTGPNFHPGGVNDGLAASAYHPSAPWPAAVPSPPSAATTTTAAAPATWEKTASSNSGTIWPRPNTVSRLPSYPAKCSASTSQASVAPEKNVKPSPISTDDSAHAQNGPSTNHSQT